jgi:hypothetical protein
MKGVADTEPMTVVSFRVPTKYVRQLNAMRVSPRDSIGLFLETRAKSFDTHLREDDENQLKDYLDTIYARKSFVDAAAAKNKTKVEAMQKEEDGKIALVMGRIGGIKSAYEVEKAPLIAEKNGLEVETAKLEDQIKAINERLHLDFSLPRMNALKTALRRFDKYMVEHPRATFDDKSIAAHAACLNLKDITTEQVLDSYENKDSVYARRHIEVQLDDSFKYVKLDKNGNDVYCSEEEALAARGA